MSKYSSDTCTEIHRIIVNKIFSDFEKCDKIKIILDGGCFGKELVEKFPAEYRILNDIFRINNLSNTHSCAIRIIDRFIQRGKLIDMSDHDLQVTLGKQCNGISEIIKTNILQENIKQFEFFLKKAEEKFQDIYAYEQVIFINNNTQVKIYCKKCDSWFFQKPSRFLSSKNPCFHCVLYGQGGNDNERTNHWSQVLKGLYIGDIHSALDQNFHMSRNIMGVIDLTNSSNQTKFNRGIKMLRIGLDDNLHSNIKPYLKQTFEFIDSIINQNKAVFVFCRAGVSRSASIVIHYLMKKYSLPYIEAFKYLKTARNVVSPNSGFEKQLIEVEEELLG